MSEAWKLPDLCLCASDIFSNLFSIRSHRPLLPIHRPHRVGGVGTVVVGGACRQTCEVADEGQLVSSTDPEGFTTYYGYDNLGRLIYRDHPMPVPRSMNMTQQATSQKKQTHWGKFFMIMNTTDQYINVIVI